MRNFLLGLLVPLAVLLCAATIGFEIQRWGVKDKNWNDGIGDQADYSFLLTSNFPGNLHPQDFHQIYWSPDAGGFMPQGSSNKDNEDRASFAQPLRTADDVRQYIFEYSGCGVWVWMDSGDYIDGVDWGLSTDTGTGANNDPADDGLRRLTAACADTDNEDLAVVFAPYPMGSRITWDWGGLDGATASRSALKGAEGTLIIGTGEAAGSSDTVTVDADLATDFSLEDDELNGLRILVTDASAGACTTTNGDARDITDYVASTGTITHDAFTGAVMDDCVFAIVATSVTEDTNIDSGAFEHVSSSDVDDGMILFINIDLKNAYEFDVFSAESKTPAMAMAFWGVIGHSSIDWNPSGQPDWFHMNEGATSYFFQSGCLQANRRCLNTSGSVLDIGGIWDSATSSSATSHLVNSQGFQAVHMGGYFQGGAIAYSSGLFHRDDPSEVGQDPADAMYTLIVDSSFINSGGPCIGMQSTAGGDVATGHTFRMLFSSIHTCTDAFNYSITDSDALDHQVYWRNVSIYGQTGNVIDLGSEGTTVTWDVQYSIFNDSVGSEFVLNGTTASSLSAAQTNLTGGDGICASGDCAEDFFGPSSGFTVDYANDNPSLHGGANQVAVRLGACSSSETLCNGTAVGSVSESMPDRISFPRWALPSGEQIRVWKLFTDAPAKGYDVGAN